METVNTTQNIKQVIANLESWDILNYLDWDGNHATKDIEGMELRAGKDVFIALDARLDAYNESERRTRDYPGSSTSSATHLEIDNVMIFEGNYENGYEPNQEELNEIHSAILNNIY